MPGIDGVRARSGRHSPLTNRAVRLSICACAAALLLGATRSKAQHLETTIMLPDTLGPLNARHLAWDDNPEHPRLYIGGDGDSGGVIVAEALTCKRLARISTGPVKALCYVSAHRKLYAAKLGTDSVKVVDCATNEVVMTVRVTGEVPVMQYNSQNDRLYCGGDTVSVIDCSADTVIHTIPATAAVFALDSTHNKLYAGSDGPLTVIDCAGDSVVATIPRVGAAGALSYNPTAGKVYATSGDTLFAARTEDDSVVAGLRFAGLAPVLACDPQRSRIYCSWPDSLGSIDCSQDTVILKARVGNLGLASALMSDTTRDRVLFIRTDGLLRAYDGTTGQQLPYVLASTVRPASRWSQGLDRFYGLAGSLMYEPYGVRVVNGAGDSIVGFVPLNLSARVVSVDSTDNKLHFAGTGYLGVVDCARNLVVAYRPTSDVPYVLCHNPNTDRLYCGGKADTISVFDCRADTQVKRIPVSGRTKQFRLHRGLNKLYACDTYYDQFQGVVNVIDCSTDSAIHCISVWDDIEFLCLIEEKKQLWCIGMGHTVVIDCERDVVIADTLHGWGTLYDACYNLKDHKVYTCKWQMLRVIHMDNPAQVDSLAWPAAEEGFGMRLCYVPGVDKLYWSALFPDDSMPPNFVDSIYVIDGRTDSVVSKLAIEGRISDMCLDGTGNYIYCATDWLDSVLFVIDARADSVVAVVGLPNNYSSGLVPAYGTGRIYLTQDWQSPGIPVIRDSVPAGLLDRSSATNSERVSPTIVRRSAPLFRSSQTVLYDAAGRRAVVLRRGLNDISGLAPGVYFGSEGRGSKEQGGVGIRKVIVTR